MYMSDGQVIFLLFLCRFLRGFVFLRVSLQKRDNTCGLILSILISLYCFVSFQILLGFCQTDKAETFHQLVQF